MNPAIPTEVLNMNNCHICGESIWEDRWPEHTNNSVKRSVCFFCFSKIKDVGRYRPKLFSRSELAVCDTCGEISACVRLTGEGWYCEDCLK